MMCQHCHAAPISRPRRLCWACYYTPGVRDLYPSTSKFGRRGVGNFNGSPPLPAFPTPALPGSPDKDRRAGGTRPACAVASGIPTTPRSRRRCRRFRKPARPAVSSRLKSSQVISSASHFRCVSCVSCED